MTKQNSCLRVTQFVKELQEHGLVEVTRRGQGKTNIYKLHFRVKSQKKGK